MLKTMLRNACDSVWLTTRIVCSNTIYLSANDKFKLVFSRINRYLKSGIQKMSLKYVDNKHSLHYVSLKFSYDFFFDCEAYKDNHKPVSYIVDRMSDKWKAYIFDELCKMSNQGLELALVPHATKDKRFETITLMKPYEGSQFQIEADLKSPDYAYLDDTLPF